MTFFDYISTRTEKTNCHAIEKMAAKKRVLVATDLDGTYGRKTHPVPPCAPTCCITGRTWVDYDAGVKKIAGHMPVYIRGTGEPDDWKAAAEWKALMITALEVDFFCEDEPRQAAIIRAKCPHVTICEVVVE